MDVGKLLTMLIRYDCGEKKVWSVVNVPPLEAEDKRHLHRELSTLKVDRTRHINRIKGLLVGQGVRLSVGKNLLEELAGACLWDGSPLPSGLQSRVEQEYASWLFVQEQIKALEAERKHLIRTSDDPCVEKVRRLMRLKGIGENSSWLFVMEFFGWREFRNRRQVGALSGLTPTPYQSGDESREQGISKAENRPIRAMAIEIAWCWLRFQPQSDLSRWFQERFGGGSKRMRKIGIVALARKLLVAWWRYLDFGELRLALNSNHSLALRHSRKIRWSFIAWRERAGWRAGSRKGPTVRWSRSPGRFDFVRERTQYWVSGIDRHG